MVFAKGALESMSPSLTSKVTNPAKSEWKNGFTLFIFWEKYSLFLGFAKTSRRGVMSKLVLNGWYFSEKFEVFVPPNVFL